MTITLKLFASLAAHLPPDARERHRLEVDIDPGSTVLDVIRHHRIPEAVCAIVLVNGNWVGRPERATRELHDGEVLAIWPPVAGGAPAFTRHLEMGVAREEFLRLLRAAVARFEADEERPDAGETRAVASGPSGTPAWSPVASGSSRTTVRWIDGGRRGTIRLVALPDRVAAPGSSRAIFHIPRHRVEIALEGYSEEEGEAFMARFHRAFLRGGG